LVCLALAFPLFLLFMVFLLEEIIEADEIGKHRKMAPK
jgi:hypothetical protein